MPPQPRRPDAPFPIPMNLRVNHIECRSALVAISDISMSMIDCISIFLFFLAMIHSTASGRIPLVDRMSRFLHLSDTGGCGEKETARQCGGLLEPKTAKTFHGMGWVPS